jgi:hypothetical protein
MALSRLPSEDVRTGVPDSMTDGLLDELLSYYIDWRQDAKAVEDAYRLWSTAPAGAEALRFSAYRAALDQEESSAAQYALVFREVERALQSAASVPDPV